MAILLLQIKSMNTHGIIVFAEFEGAYTAQAFVFCDRAAPDAELVVVAFRGTPAFDVSRWRADLDPSWYKVPRLGRVRAPYAHALGAQRNMGWPKWIEHIKGRPQKVPPQILCIEHC